MAWWNPFSWAEEAARPAPKPLPPAEQVVIGGLNLSQQAQLVRALGRLHDGLDNPQMGKDELVRWQRVCTGFGVVPPASPLACARLLEEQASLGNRYARAWVNSRA